MAKEPDIVKALREEEQKGKLRSFLRPHGPEKAPDVFEEQNLETIEELLDEKKGPHQKPLCTPNTSQETIQILMNLITDPVVIVDAKGKFLDMSDGVEELLGIKKEDLLGTNFMKASFIPTKTKALFVKNLATRMLGKGMDKYEVELVGKNGEPKLLEVKGMKVDYQGKPADLVLFKDISEQRKAEQALLEKEEQWSSLIHNIPDVIFIVEHDGTVLSVNHSLTGLESKHLIGKPVYELLGPAYRDILQSKIEEVFETGKSESCQIQGKGSGNQRVWFETRIAPIIRNGEVIDAILIGRDITERKKADEILRENEERYKSIVENSLDVIILTQPDGTISYISPSCNEVLGYDPLELAGTAQWVAHPDDAKAVSENFAKVFKGKSQKNFEYRIKTKKGETKWISHTLSPIFKYNEPHLIVSVIRDINEQKEAEEQLKEKLDELEKFQEMTVDRELKMIELKKEVNTLCKKCGEKPKYIMDEKNEERKKDVVRK
ncbi:MAG: PAS domain S-box protein [Candidatus Thermoplasmatota archaeon]|nr:PAS domain S-box protein [Candidatus Thermoplasmatota archaeon]